MAVTKKSKSAVRPVAKKRATAVRRPRQVVSRVKEQSFSPFFAVGGLIVLVMILLGFSSPAVWAAPVVSQSSPDQQATVIVNVNGGSASASDFTVTVTNDNPSLAPSPSTFPGAASTSVDLGLAGNYNIFEATSSLPANYTPSYSTNCSGATSPGDQIVTCTITNTYTVPTPSTTLLDLAVTKTVDVADPAPGTTVNFTVTAYNLTASNMLATGVTVSDVLPTGLAFVSDTSSAGSYNSSTGQWTLSKLFANFPQTLAIAATVNATTTGATITNTATITPSSIATDTDFSNNTASVTLTIASSTSGGGSGGTPTSTTSTAVSSADLSITKSIDDATPNEGDTVNYLVTATDLGPATSTGVMVNDILPVGLAFVSANASMGSYTSSTGLWTVGDMSDNATATLIVVATVNTGTAGSTITNTATASESASSSDPDLSNNTASVSLTVATSTANNNGGNGGSGSQNNIGVSGGSGGNGGGGGGGGFFFPFVTNSTSSGGNGTSTDGGGAVLGASTTCGIYLPDYLKKGSKSDVANVKKLQTFLNQNLGLHLPVTGFFGPETFAAVKQFQLKYADEVLAPWVAFGLPNSTTPTGYVYKLTVWKINELMCPALGLPAPKLP